MTRAIYPGILVQNHSANWWAYPQWKHLTLGYHHLIKDATSIYLTDKVGIIKKPACLTQENIQFNMIKSSTTEKLHCNHANPKHCSLPVQNSGNSKLSVTFVRVGKGKDYTTKQLIQEEWFSSLSHGILKHHILPRKLPVDTCKGLQLVLGVVSLLRVQVNLPWEV